MTQEQIIDEAYENYENAYYKGHAFGYKKLNDNEFSPDLKISKEDFINICKTDSEFSETWGLKIEERELSLIERTEILVSRSDHKKDFYDRNGRLIVEEHTLVLDESNVPTKLITLTYKKK